MAPYCLYPVSGKKSKHKRNNKVTKQKFLEIFVGSVTIKYSLNILNLMLRLSNQLYKNHVLTKKINYKSYFYKG